MEKIAIGPLSLIIPSTIVIVGTEIDGTPNFMTVAYNGTIQDEPPVIMISSSIKNRSNKGIKAYKTFSVNIPSIDMIKTTDLIGSTSGDEIDKENLFEIEFGKLSTAPMIKNAPISMECTLFKTLYVGDKYEMFLGKIVETYVNRNIETNGFPDVKKVNPILYSMSDDHYYSVGERIGKAHSTEKANKKD